MKAFQICSAATECFLRLLEMQFECNLLPVPSCILYETMRGHSGKLSPCPCSRKQSHSYSSHNQAPIPHNIQQTPAFPSPKTHKGDPIPPSDQTPAFSPSDRVSLPTHNAFSCSSSLFPARKKPCLSLNTKSNMRLLGAADCGSRTCSAEVMGR